MVQVIQLHPYKDCYPFGLDKQSECTYVEMIKQMTSQIELQTYRQNLVLFKSIQSQLIISLDSYVKQNNNLQLYYEYEPISIKYYIEQRMVLMAEQHQRDKFLTRIITNINLSIQQIIALLMSKKILALLSIQNMAITQSQKIRFFIEPDFQYIEKSTQTQLNQYYSTEKKKLQIQLEQFLEHIFSFTNKKPKDHSKANFVIQGTKLVFVNEEQANRQSSMLPVNILPNQRQQNKLPAYMLKDPESQNNNNNSSKQKFDIKNILDEKKLQKNQSQFSSAITGKQSNNSGQTLISQRNVLKKSFGDGSEEIRVDKDGKQVRNYFENNDDFNKDASFYPQQFIKEDSIAEFDGYEDQLEKELEDLKNKQFQAQQIANTSKNRMSMVPNTPINPQLSDQKMNKTPTLQQTLPTIMTPNYSASHKYPSSSQFPKNILNSSNSQENDTSTQQQKQKKKYKVTITTSHEVDVDDEDVDMKVIEKELIEDIRKGTLKSTNINDINNNSNNSNNNNNSNNSINIAKQQSPTLVKGTSEKQSGFPPSLPLHLLKGHTRETHNPNSSHQIYTSQPTTSAPVPPQKPTSLNSIGSNSIEQHIVDEKPFSKQHPHIISQTGQYVYSSNKQPKDVTYNSGTFTNQGSSTISNGQQSPDIKKIIEKIKNNSQNQQQNNSNNNSYSNSSSNSITQNSQYQHNNNPSQQTTSTKVSQQQYSSTQSHNQQQSQKPQYQGEQDTRPHSQLSSHGKQIMNSQKKQHQYDKEYYDKIQKAKLKAEQIMKLVKERKGQ